MVFGRKEGGCVLLESSGLTRDFKKKYPRGNLRGLNQGASTNYFYSPKAKCPVFVPGVHLFFKGRVVSLRVFRSFPYQMLKDYDHEPNHARAQSLYCGSGAW
jgi:hypothetical protein